MEGGLTLRVADAAAIVIYALAMLGLGWWTSRRIKGTDGYFVGNRSIPGFAVGLSLLGTAISSVTFLAYPGSAFAGNWTRLVPGLMLPIAALIAVRYFVVFYRRTMFVSAYEYFERRFGSWGRSYASILFSLGSIYRMGIILFLLSLPIRVVTGWSVPMVIVVVGVIVTIYTVMGGLEAVIWTDVVQTLVLILGGLVTLTIVFMRIPGGIPEVLHRAAVAHKFDLVVSFDFNFARETFWMFALAGIIGNIQEFSTDQTKIQRYEAAKSDRSALGAVWTVGLGCIPIWTLFMFVGTALWVFYQEFPGALAAGLKPDEVYPHFILTEMPPGVGGFVIAAVLAAAMSSIDSSMNGTATVLTVDFYKKYLVRGRDDKHYLKAARWISMALGGIMIVAAYTLSLIPGKTILDIGFFIGAVMGGGLGGFFLLGFVSNRTNKEGATVGVVATVLVIFWCTLSHLGAVPEAVACHIHPFLIGVAANVTFFVVGFVASYFFPKPDLDQIAGMTWWTREMRKPRAVSA
ncbi:MAG: sodium:solute symporter [Calditrichaeota bacterium]|nr:sodium:solute symporter [Calditrichota bacterium]